MANPLINASYALGNQSCLVFCTSGPTPVQLPEAIDAELLRAKNRELEELVQKILKEKSTQEAMCSLQLENKESDGVKITNSIGKTLISIASAIATAMVLMRIFK